jgi:hypothetical protein
VGCDDKLGASRIPPVAYRISFSSFHLWVCEELHQPTMNACLTILHRLLVCHSLRTRSACGALAGCVPGTCQLARWSTARACSVRGIRGDSGSCGQIRRDNAQARRYCCDCNRCGRLADAQTIRIVKITSHAQRRQPSSPPSQGKGFLPRSRSTCQGSVARSPKQC